MIVGAIVGIASFVLGLVAGFALAGWDTVQMLKQNGLVIAEGGRVVPVLLSQEEIERIYAAVLQDEFGEAPRVD